MRRALLGLVCCACGQPDFEVDPPQGRALFLGGWDTAQYTHMSDGGIYDVAEGTWSRPDGLNNAPIQPRTGHSAVFTGTSLVVWGGEIGLETTSDGAVYDLASDSWTTPPGLASGPLVPRSDHAAVWTGSEMLVWGGANRFDHDIAARPDGALYNPRSDRWRVPPNLANGNVLADSSAIWTGTSMIVWSGHRGAVYDYASDQWSYPQGLASPPPMMTSTLTGACMVWTGSEILVWGGYVLDGGGVADGAIYNVELDEWRQPPGLAQGGSALEGRWDAGCAWVDGGMIVWGGNGHPDGYFDDGAVYQPALDAWAMPEGLLGPLSSRVGLSVTSLSVGSP